MKIWSDFLKPIVVLGVICIVTSTLLAVTNNVTAPIIEKNAAAAADATRSALLPTADAFTKVETKAPGVTEMYSADNGSGYVITAEAKGYAGAVPVMMAFDMDGKIVAAKFLKNAETPGLGQKVRADQFGGQFASKEAAPLSMSDIDAVSGATISSGAALSAVNAAIAAYSEVAGIEHVDLAALSEDEVHAMILPDSGALRAYDIPNADEKAAYKGEKYGTIIYAQVPGFYKKPLLAAVGFDDNGIITGVWFDASNETDGVGKQVGTDARFAAGFVGDSGKAEADAVAGASVSSAAAIQAVNEAIAYYNAGTEAAA
ncbi:MAG: FMN-binding protein [Ruthenibacterium sp.]